MDNAGSSEVLPVSRGVEALLDGERLLVILPGGGVQLCIGVSPKELLFLRDHGLIPELSRAGPTVVRNGLSIIEGGRRG